VLSSSGFKPCYRGLRRTDTLGHLCLSYTRCGTCLQKFIEKGKFFIKPVMFSFNIRAAARAAVKFFIKRVSYRLSDKTNLQRGELLPNSVNKITP
jgi:hypothetical protein